MHGAFTVRFVIISPTLVPASADRGGGGEGQRVAPGICRVGVGWGLPHPMIWLLRCLGLIWLWRICFASDFDSVILLPCLHVRELPLHGPVL